MKFENKKIIRNLIIVLFFIILMLLSLYLISSTKKNIHLFSPKSLILQSQEIKNEINTNEILNNNIIKNNKINENLINKPVTYASNSEFTGIEEKRVVTATKIFNLKVISGASSNQKRILVNLWENPEGNLVVLWKVLSTAYKKETNLVINGESYVDDEIEPGAKLLVVVDTDGNIINEYKEGSGNKEYYFFAQTLKPTQRISENFEVTITTRSRRARFRRSII